jgi:hypothetical protein
MREVRGAAGAADAAAAVMEKRVALPVPRRPVERLEVGSTTMVRKAAAAPA